MIALLLAHGRDLLLTLLVLGISGTCAAIVTLTEPGGLPRLLHQIAYHRAGGRHARPRATSTALTTVPDGGLPC